MQKSSKVNLENLESLLHQAALEGVSASRNAVPESEVEKDDGLKNAIGCVQASLMDLQSQAAKFSL